MTWLGGLAANAVMLGALVLGSGTASAQNWNGFYIGGSAGGGSAVGDGLTSHGGLGGLQGGYNWQNGSILAGVEGDYLWSGIKGSGTCLTPAFVCNEKLTGLGSVRGRLGWVAIPSAMIYFTGGVGWGSQQFSGSDGTAANTASFSRMSSGLVLGGGAEFLLSRNWTIKAEYLHYNLGSYNPTFSGSTVQGPLSFKDDANTFKLGINYKF